MLHISVINPVKQRVNCMALVVTEQISLAKRQARYLAFSLTLYSHVMRFFSFESVLELPLRGSMMVFL